MGDFLKWAESNPVRAEWRTSTVVDLCRSMREAQDWSALPILADALQDAGCGDEVLLLMLRGGPHRYATAAGLAACVLSDDARDAVLSLLHFADGNDCPDYETLVAAAAGRHEENAIPDSGGPYDSYFRSQNDGEYLFFGGRDAHGPIRPEFWDWVQKATGQHVPQTQRATDFSCSC